MVVGWSYDINWWSMLVPFPKERKCRVWKETANTKRFPRKCSSSRMEMVGMQPGIHSQSQRTRETRNSTCRFGLCFSKSRKRIASFSLMWMYNYAFPSNIVLYRRSICLNNHMKSSYAN